MVRSVASCDDLADRMMVYILCLKCVVNKLQCFIISLAVFQSLAACEILYITFSLLILI